MAKMALMSLNIIISNAHIHRPNNSVSQEDCTSVVHEDMCDEFLSSFPWLLQQHWLPREYKVHETDGGSAGYLDTQENTYHTEMFEEKMKLERVRERS